MGGFTKKDYLDYAWKHFTVIADQRLKTFNFYIIIAGASVAATVSAFRNDHPFLVLIACGILHLVCALVFFLIDQRSLRLVNIPKTVMAKIEDEEGWNLFTADIAGQKRFLNKISSYTVAFRLAFITQCLFGLIVISTAFFGYVTSSQNAFHGAPSKPPTQWLPKMSACNQYW